uniref:Uncharacterized protein n=1 Tax=Timema cristinae TaxID=61476 RepID=A0A7R9CG43_TIMCR|nr:unnamed protein product [Timema cristinae]
MSLLASHCQSLQHVRDGRLRSLGDSQLGTYTVKWASATKNKDMLKKPCSSEKYLLHPREHIFYHSTSINRQTNINLQSLKYDVKQVMTHNYVKLSAMPEDPANFQSRAAELSREMERLEERIQIQIKGELQNSTGELQTLSVSLQKAALKLQFINQLVTVDTLLKRASEAHSNKQYLDEVEALKSLLELLQQTTKTESPDIFRALSLERVCLYERFMWEEMQLDNGCHQTSLKVVVDTDGELERVFQALASLDQLTLNLHKFSTKVLKLLLEPCILQCVSVKCVGDKDSNTAVIDVKSTANTTLARPELPVVLSNLKAVLEFLATHLNIPVGDRGTFLHLVGEVISEELCRCLITDCLGEHVPSSSRELPTFDIVAQQIQCFQVNTDTAQ